MHLGSQTTERKRDRGKLRTTRKGNVRWHAHATDYASYGAPIRNWREYRQKANENDMGNATHTQEISGQRSVQRNIWGIYCVCQLEAARRLIWWNMEKSWRFDMGWDGHGTGMVEKSIDWIEFWATQTAYCLYWISWKSTWNFKESKKREYRNINSDNTSANLSQNGNPLKLNLTRKWPLMASYGWKETKFTKSGRNICSPCLSTHVTAVIYSSRIYWSFIRIRQYRCCPLVVLNGRNSLRHTHKDNTDTHVLYAIH